MQIASQSDSLRWLPSNTGLAWTTFALLLIIGLVSSFRKWRRSHRSQTKSQPPQPIFEIPDTAKSRAFAARNPHFLDALLKLFEPANKCFGRDPRPKNHLEDVCFWLGHTWRQDFLEIVFLSINGYGARATKILRRLYERAVTIADLIQSPEKAERFLQFAAIQENRAMEAALRQISPDQIDAQMGPRNTIAEIRKRYEEYKGNFKATTCAVCGVKTPPSWDVDLATMIQRVGEPYKRLFVLAYTSPNFQIHATLASASKHGEDREEHDAKSALMVATDLFLSVIASQNALFSLNLKDDLEACTNDLRDAMGRDLSPS
jgi:hypothetical protein